MQSHTPLGCFGPDCLRIATPFDAHVHLRDGGALASVLPFTARQFKRSVVMPNLNPGPITTAALAVAYQKRILDVLPAGSRFEPLMTLYLTDNTSPDEVRRARDAGVVAFKLYPAGATTHSDAGVTDLRKCYPTLEAMQRESMLLLVHGEVTDPEVDIFDREAVFIDRVMRPTRRDLPQLKVVFEHVTTKEGVDYVRDGGKNIAATITAHHLLYSRNALFQGGLRPHYYCLPVPKSEQHRQALVEAATSGNPQFFLGTDSAPHAVEIKERSVCGAGCFTAPAALELYAEAFEAANALDKFEGFASLHGPAFYNLASGTGMVTLRRQPWQIPESLTFGNTRIKPYRGGETIPWKFFPN